MLKHLELNIFTPEIWFDAKTIFKLLCMKPAAETNQNSWIENVQCYAQNLNLGVEINTACPYIFILIQMWVAKGQEFGNFYLLETMYIM